MKAPKMHVPDSRTNGNTLQKRHPRTALLLSGAVAATLVGLLTLQAPRTPERHEESKADSSDSAEDTALPRLGQARLQSPHASKDASITPKGMTHDVPPLERVLLARLPDVSVRMDIALRGIDALMPDFECEPPYTKVETARIRSGEIGCGVTKSDGFLVRLGRWVKRHENGNLEAGHYQDGLKTGVWETYSDAGMLLEKGEYELDHRQGVWNTFGNDGVHLAQRSYRRGYFHGTAMLFHRAKPIVEVWDMGQLIQEERDFPESQLVFESDGTHHPIEVQARVATGAKAAPLLDEVKR